MGKVGASFEHCSRPNVLSYHNRGEPEKEDYIVDEREEDCLERFREEEMREDAFSERRGMRDCVCGAVAGEEEGTDFCGVRVG